MVSLAACSGGSSPAPAPPPPPPPPSSVTISGAVAFESVPFNPATNGLNYGAISQQPARGVVVEALNAGGGVVATSVTDLAGAYSFTVSSNTDIRIQAQARISASAWDIAVRDNTNGNALYVLAGSLTNSGTSNSTRNLLARSGWGGVAYTGVRAAAPFAILDFLQRSVTQISSVAPGTNFPAAQVYWSPLNRATDGDIAAGEIGSTSYTRIGGVPTILVLGNENNDTDEYDPHVIVHEFGHYVEDTLARADTVGGPHSLNQRLDPRVAMSEGWSNAFSGAVLGDPVYRDSLGAQQASGFSFNLESNSSGNPGWFSEASVQSIVFDLADSAVDGPDTIAGGLGLVLNSLTGAIYTNNDAPTTIFAYLDSVRAQPGANVATVDALRSAQSISGTNAAGAGETNDGGIPTALPVLRTLTVGAGPMQICSVDDAGTINKLGNRVFMRLSAAFAQTLTFVMTRTSGPTGRDPDFEITRRGTPVAAGFSDAPDTETLTVTLGAGEYAIDAYDFLNISDTGPSGDVCFNFSAN